MSKKKHGKKYEEAKKLIEDRKYTLADAIPLLKKTALTKFDSSCEVHMKLGVDPKQADQNIRTTVSLPHGLGKVVRVVAFVGEEKIKEALASGAVEAGTENLVEKIEKGWLEFDAAVATPDQMKNLGKIAKILGQKKLMPNPKSGTVTTEIAKTIGELQKGKIEIRLDKEANLHSVFGKASFDEEKLTENFLALFKTVVDAKPATSKGTYLRSVTVATTMGPGITLDPSDVSAKVK